MHNILVGISQWKQSRYCCTIFKSYANDFHLKLQSYDWNGQHKIECARKWKQLTSVFNNLNFSNQYENAWNAYGRARHTRINQSSCDSSKRFPTFSKWIIRMRKINMHLQRYQAINSCSSQSLMGFFFNGFIIKKENKILIYRLLFTSAIFVFFLSKLSVKNNYWRASRLWISQFYLSQLGY